MVRRGLALGSSPCRTVGPYLWLALPIAPSSPSPYATSSGAGCHCCSLPGSSKCHSGAIREAGELCGTPPPPRALPTAAHPYNLAERRVTKHKRFILFFFPFLRALRSISAQDTCGYTAQPQLPPVPRCPGRRLFPSLRRLLAGLRAHLFSGRPGS